MCIEHIKPVTMLWYVEGERSCECRYL